MPSTNQSRFPCLTHIISIAKRGHRPVQYLRQLSIHLHPHPRLELHSKPVLINGDLLNQPPDQLLVIFRYLSGLLPQERAHVRHPLAKLVAVGVLRLDFLFLLTKTVDILGYIFIVGLGVGQLHKLHLKLLQLTVDLGQGVVVLSAEHGGDVFLQGCEKVVPPAQCIVDGGNGHLFEGALQHRAGVAVQAGVLQPADAPPNDGFLTAVVPVDPTKHLAAVAADDYIGKTMVTAEVTLFAALAEMDATAAHQFFLHLHEDLARNDGFVAVLHIVLGHEPIILDALLRKEVHGVGLLQEGVTDVLFVSENLGDVASVPFLASRAIFDAISYETPRDFQRAGALQVLPVDALNDLGLLGDNHQMLVFILGVPKKPLAVDLDFPLLVAVLEPHLHVLAQGLAFLLGEGSHDRQQDFTLGVHGTNALFFKEHGNVLILQLANVIQAVHGISGEPADGLGDDHVDVAGHALVNHPIELFPLLGVGSGDAIVSETPYGQFPKRQNSVNPKAVPGTSYCRAAYSGPLKLFSPACKASCDALQEGFLYSNGFWVYSICST